MSIHKHEERCSCGASIDIEGYAPTVREEVREWRSKHKHITPTQRPWQPNPTPVPYQPTWTGPTITSHRNDG